MMNLAKTIVVSTPGTILSIDQTHYTLRSGGRKIGRIPPMMIDHLVIGSQVEVTRRAMNRLCSHGVSVTFLDHEGRASTRLCPVWRNTPETRIGLYSAWADPAQKIQISRILAGSKMTNSLALLRAYQKNYREVALKEAIVEIDKSSQKLHLAESVSEVMGLEGWAARAYWKAFGTLLRPEFLQWNGRNRRPPRDPANAALSYGYGILLNRVLSLIEASGLDPWIGFLHETSGRHPSLALDLMEPFRPAVVDRLVLRLLNRGQLRPEHFDRPQPLAEVVHLNREGRLILLESFEAMFRSVEEAAFEGCDSIAGAITETIDAFRTHAREQRLTEFNPLNPTHASTL
jgi:CRISPR-associated protein Cas1